MDVLFVGYFYSPEQESEIIYNSKKTVQFAANKFQMNLLDGLKSNLDEKSNLDAFSLLPVGSFPLNNRKLIYKSSTLVINNVRVIFSSFINLPVLKNCIRKYNLKKYIKNYICSDKSEKIIVTYSVNNEIMKTVLRFRKIKNLKTHIIVPDLPPPYGITKNYFKSLNIFIGNRKIRTLSKFDSFTFLTEHMMSAVPFSNKPFCVVEGMIDVKDITNVNTISYKKKKKAILYTGTIEREFGLEKLVTEFMKNPHLNIELWICGEGSYKNELTKIIRNDNRIIFYGQLSNQKAMELQRIAYILINPRSNDEYTKYSFPSKIFEYLKSGTIILSQKLEGIPKEYYSYLFVYDENEINNMVEQIESIMEYSYFYLDNFVKNAKNWAFRYKNKTTQSAKILDTLSQLYKGSIK